MLYWKYFLLFIFLLPFTSFAQFSIGIKAGYNYFIILDNAEQDPHYTAKYSSCDNSFYTGISGDMALTKHFKAGAELEYMNYSFGVQSDYGGLGGGTETDLHYDLGYLNLVFMPEFAFGRKWKFLLNPGIYLGFLLHSHVEGTTSSWIMGEPSYAHDTLDSSAQSEFNEINLGIRLGIGVSVQLSKRIDLILESRYAVSISKITGTTRWGGDCRFLDLGLSFGVSYRLSR